MASYFGEIIEPSTRALFDEFDEDDQSFKEKKLQLIWNEKAQNNYNTLFVVHGRLSLAFTEAYLIDDNSSPVAEINIEEETDNNDDDSYIHSHKSLPSRLYKEGSSLICLVSPSYTADLGFQFVNTISQLLKNSEKIIVLTNESIYNFKTSSINELPPAFIKELKTTANKSKELADALPIPNIITGIPAAVASWCQIFKKAASVLICYTDQQKLDSVTALPYTRVLKKLNSKMKDNPDLNKNGFYGNPEIIGESSNIYI